MCQIILFRIIHARNQIIIVYCSLKSMSLSEIGARGDAKCQNLTAPLKRRKYLEKKSFW